MAQAFRTSQRDHSGNTVAIEHALDQGAQPSLWQQGQQHSNATKRAVDRRRVLTWFVGNQRGTPDECAEGLGMDILAVRPRVHELADAGCLAKTDAPRRPTGRGGTAAEYRVTDGGLVEYRAGGPSSAA